MTALYQIIRFLIFIIIIASLSTVTILRNTVWENRLALWRHVIEISPQKARGHYNLGNAFTAFNMYEEAMREYLTAIDINPSFFYGNVHGALGIVYVRKGLLDAAFNEFRIALQMNPHSAKPHYGLGIIYEQRGSLEDAIREYSLAAAIEPNYAEPYASLGIVYGKKDMLPEARNALEKAIELHPETAYPHYNLAVTLDKLGDYKYAISHYREFLKRTSKEDSGLHVKFSKKRIAELENFIGQ